MPSTEGFVERLFEDNKGVWQYLEDHLDVSARLQLKVHNIDDNKVG